MLDDPEMKKEIVEYIKWDICTNRGTHNMLMKADLLRLAREVGCEVNENTSKAELIDFLADKIGYKRLAILGNVGVSPFEYQKKFGLSLKDVKLLAKNKHITIVGREEFFRHGKTCYTPKFDLFEFFNYTEDVLYHYLHKKKSSAV